MFLSFNALVSMSFLFHVFASYRSDLEFNVCLKCRNEYKVYNIVCNLMVRCEYGWTPFFRCCSGAFARFVDLFVACFSCISCLFVPVLLTTCG